MFYIYQTQEDGTSHLLYETYDEDLADATVNRINSNLSAAGIPSWVSSAYYQEF